MSASKIRKLENKSTTQLCPATIGEFALKLLENKDFCDVIFIVGPKKDRIECHKLILIARSSVFETMFSRRWDADKKELELPDVEPRAFKLFLKVKIITFWTSVSTSLYRSLLHNWENKSCDYIVIVRCSLKSKARI